MCAKVDKICRMALFVGLKCHEKYKDAEGRGCYVSFVLWLLSYTKHREDTNKQTNNRNQLQDMKKKKTMKNNFFVQSLRKLDVFFR